MYNQMSQKVDLVSNFRMKIWNFLSSKLQSIIFKFQIIKNKNTKL